MMGVSGVKAINSSSSQSATQVVLHFDLTDINEAAEKYRPPSMLQCHNSFRNAKPS
jgi:multidrug efflux pump subunit AcrB